MYQIRVDRTEPAGSAPLRPAATSNKKKNILRMLLAGVKLFDKEQAERLEKEDKKHRKKEKRKKHKKHR